MCVYINSLYVYYNKEHPFVNIKPRNFYRDAPPARGSVGLQNLMSEEMRNKQHLAESFCLLPAGHRKIFHLHTTPLWKQQRHAEGQSCLPLPPKGGGHIQPSVHVLIYTLYATSTQRAYKIPGMYPRIVNRRQIQNSNCKTKNQAKQCVSGLSPENELPPSCILLSTPFTQRTGWRDYIVHVPWRECIRSVYFQEDVSLLHSSINNI